MHTCSKGSTERARDGVEPRHRSSTSTRALATLGVRREPLRELTSLFAEARFSTHRITEDDRAAAVRALTEARADLEGVTAS